MVWTVSWCKKLVETNWFQWTILGVIIFNSITMGLQTWNAVTKKIGTALDVIDWIVVAIFTIEIILKFFAYNYKFFFDAWNVFDLIIIAFCYVPNAGSASALRAFRAVRAFRSFKLTGKIKRLKVIVDSIIQSLPSVGWTTLLLLIFFYTYSIVGTNLFGEEFPDLFGTIFKTAFTLYQLMIFDGWALEIAKPVMDEHPAAVIYFIPFVLLASFIVMNVIVGVVVNTVADVDSGDDVRPISVGNACEITEIDLTRQNLESSMMMLQSHMQNIKDLIQKYKVAQERKPFEAPHNANDDDNDNNYAIDDNTSLVNDQNKSDDGYNQKDDNNTDL